ncbi:hypothetical protein AB0F46_26250 [Streptomyces sp. NPDC026665]|uniref:hypothetical protein n=1 Tax=Streptomyces sp. NPDC026665 TaxID=3154798 RepID=UPI0033D17B08
MSFDLAVWFESGRVSVADATRTYERLCDGDLTGAGVVANEAVAAFHRELTDRFPAPSAADDDAPAEASPWTGGLDVSAAHVIMPMSWSRADGTAPEVVDLAGRHGLVCLDPQAQVLHRPPAQRGAGGLSLRPCVGLKVEDADPDVIDRAVRRLSAENWFLILERRSGHFLQVGHGPNAGLATDDFAVEHREGSMERHYRCVLSRREEVIALFADYAAGANTWSVDAQWAGLF